MRRRRPGRANGRHDATITTATTRITTITTTRTRCARQPVVLDLGDGVGALIVHTDPELLGDEVDISPAGDDGHRQHKQVLRRRWEPR